MQLTVRVLAQWMTLLLMTAASSLAQISNATLTGSVTDATGAAVAGAMVQVKSLSTQLVRNATADNSGEYVIPDLPARTLYNHCPRVGLQSLHGS